MEVEDYLKRTPDLLTNRYKVMMLMIIIFGIEFAWLLRDSEITTTTKNGIVIGIFIAGGFVSIFLTVLAKKLDDDILRRRKDFITNLQKELENKKGNDERKKTI